MRTSSYVIYVDLPETRDEVLLVHGYTGAYDRVNRKVAAFLRKGEAGHVPRPLHGTWDDHDDPAQPVEPPSPAALATLTARGYLTDMEVEEETRFLSENIDRWHAARALQAPQFIFMPTYDCNLRCAYCFQDQMRTDPKLDRLLRTMSPEVVDRIFQAVPKIQALHGVSPERAGPLSIGFFGGEPLLARARPIIEHIMKRAREAGDARFWAVSNAAELDAYEDLLGPQGIAVVQITLDGPPAEHDRRRIYPDGSGSFDKISANIAMALSRGTQVQVRLNVDRDNVGDLPAVARLAIAEGWTRAPGFSMYTAPINAVNGTTDARTTFNTWQLKEAMEALREDHPEISAFALPDERLKQTVHRIFVERADPTPLMKSAFCSAHDRMYIFDAFADIYACWERTGDDKVRIGRVIEDGGIESNSPLLKQWRSRTASSNPVCAKCRYVLHCGGGCAILAEAKHGRFFGNHCDAFGKRFRASVADAYADLVAGKDVAQATEAVCDQ